MPPLLSTQGLTKWFGHTHALDDVDFDLEPGELHVLFGENGAGKSTLAKIISGVYAPDAGTIHLGERAVEIPSPTHARAFGIATVFQDFSLIPSLAVLDNLFLGKEMTSGLFLDRPAMRRRGLACDATARGRSACVRLRRAIPRRLDETCRTAPHACSSASSWRRSTPRGSTRCWRCSGTWS